MNPRKIECLRTMDFRVCCMHSPATNSSRCPSTLLANVTLFSTFTVLVSSTSTKNPNWRAVTNTFVSFQDAESLFRAFSGQFCRKILSCFGPVSFLSAFRHLINMSSSESISCQRMTSRRVHSRNRNWSIPYLGGVITMRLFFKTKHFRNHYVIYGK